ncbi:MAG: DUF4469 domain-containing protein [Anaerolineae bacterium]|nr:DUF4469 domain-containing protein [Anaerolineae bacterium]
MTIDYKLHEYNFAAGGDYRARVQHQRTIDLDGVIDAMAMHNSGLSRALMVGVFYEFLRTLVFLLVDGHKIETPFATFKITIKGTFTSPDDQFDSRRHTVEIAITPGNQLQKDFAAEAKPRKCHLKVAQPMISRCTNGNSPTATTTLTAGRMAGIQGRNLKFDLNDPTQGIFLTPVKGYQDPTPLGPPVRVEDVGHNKGRKLVFVVPPDLPPGAYRLEVCARFGRHSLRTGHFDKLLTVA